MSSSERSKLKAEITRRNKILPKLVKEDFGGSSVNIQVAQALIFYLEILIDLQKRLNATYQCPAERAVFERAMKRRGKNASI